jgi:hypothetical protein
MKKEKYVVYIKKEKVKTIFAKFITVDWKL